MSSGIRVLHVDDDASFRELTTEYLEREGFDVTTVDGATAAVDALDGDIDIDCIVSDYDMPETDGLELLDAVRERDPELPYLLFTGKGSEEIASEAISAGVTDYLQKETSTEQFTLLVNRIERAVAERRTEEALEESERMLSTLVSNLPGVVYRRRNDPGWPMEYVGGNVAEMTGYEASEFLGRGVEWERLLVEADREETWETIQRAIAAREPFEVTYRITDAEGETRWLREQGQGVFDGSDDAVAIEGFVTEVTDRKRRERELTEYDRLVGAMGDAVYTTDAEGHITTFNERAEELLGYDRSEVIGEHVSMLLDSEELTRSEAVVRELLGPDGDATTTYELSVRTADGDVVELENHVALLTTDGEYRGTIGVLRRGHDSPDSRLRRLHDATRELMTESDPDRIAALTLQAAKEILGQPIASIRFEDDGELVPANITEEARELLRERPVYPIEGTPAGKAFREGEPHVEADLDTVADGFDRGPVASAAYFPLSDRGVFIIGATERDAFGERDIQLATILAANAEAAFSRAEKETALRRERDDFATLFENIPDPTVETVMTDADPIVRRVNPAFESVFGYDSEELVDESLDDYILPADADAEAARFNEQIQRGDSFHGEVRRVAADGLRDFILHVVPHDVGEDGTRGYAIYTDITEQKERERELERQNERLDQFASVVSHDLRNPLSVARGALELARTTGDEEQFEAVERAHDRIDELINGILALARQGELVDDPIPLELEASANAAWETVDTGDLSLVFDDPPAITADPERIRQLLENLFRNTVEHGSTSPDSRARRDAVERGSTSARSQAREAATGHDEGASTVTVGALPDGFYVEDDGPGIPESDREQIFDSGYSGDGGTGFGLAIVESIAEAHGWNVTVTESEGGGARFEFRDDPVPEN